MLLQGDVLIPTRPFSYCLRVDRINHEVEWVASGFLHVVCTRFDLSRDREPVLKNAAHLFIVEIREVAKGVFRSARRADWGNTGLPVYFRKWKPKRGQLTLF